VESGASYYCFDKGKIGDVNAALIDSAIPNHIGIYAFRQPAEHREEFTVMVDEFQTFLARHQLDYFFAELRKIRYSLLACHGISGAGAGPVGGLKAQRNGRTLRIETLPPTRNPGIGYLNERRYPASRRTQE
jgi:hypothetical protein